MTSRNAMEPFRCAFCGRDQDEKRRLVAGPGQVHICNECVDLIRGIFNEGAREPGAGPRRATASSIQQEQPTDWAGQLTPGGTPTKAGEANLILARVYVTLKPTVNDPQGLTIQGALRSLGFASIESVRAGKYLEIRLPGVSVHTAGAMIDEMCRKLLANPVIEDYRFEIEPVT